MFAANVICLSACRKHIMSQKYICWLQTLCSKTISLGLQVREYLKKIELNRMDNERIGTSFHFCQVCFEIFPSPNYNDSL